MTFLDVLNMIRDTANVVNPTGTFVHGRNAAAANASDKPYPRIHLFPFTQDSEPLDIYKRTSNLFLAFVEADSGSQDETEREGIINRMDILADSFLEQLTTDYENDIEFTTLRREPQYQILEGVSGYSLQLNFKSQTGC